MLQAYNKLMKIPYYINPYKKNNKRAVPFFVKKPTLIYIYIIQWGQSQSGYNDSIY